MMRPQLGRRKLCVSGPGTDMRQVAALNRWAITQVISNVVLPGNAPLSVLQAAQLGFVSRSCRKALFLKGGGNEGDLEDIDPWDQRCLRFDQRLQVRVL